MQSQYLFLALDLARERAAEANRERLAALAHEGPSRPGLIRRVIARIAIAVARAADERVVVRTSVATH